MDQLIVVLMIVAFTGADLFLRWMKKRRGGGTSAPPRRQDADLPGDVDDAMDVPDWFEQLRRQQQEQRRMEDEARRRAEQTARQAEVQRAPVPERQPRREPLRPKPSRPAPATAPVRQPAEQPFPSEGPKPRLVPTPAEAALAAKMEQTTGTRRSRGRAVGGTQVRQWMANPQDVRKGFILMNVLGPPRSLE